MLNARERPTLDQALDRELKPLGLEEALALASEGAQLLDTRESTQFEGAYLRGAINIGLGGSYATWCGTILDRESPIVLVSGPGSEVEAATRLGRIGFDTVAGYLAGGMQPLERAPQLVERIERITASALAEQLASQTPPVVIDVRIPSEYEQARIEPALNIPLAQLPARLATLRPERSLVVHCASGYRSAIAASLLRRAGFERVFDLVGGIGAWEACSQGSRPASA